MSEAQNGGNVMERLTKRLPGGAADYNYPASCYFDDDPGADRISKSAFRQKCVEQLADYEDTELTPQEVLSMKFEWCAMMAALNSIGGGYTRLRELAEADRDGRLVVLPFTSRRTLLCKENIDSPRLMKDVELAIRYCSSCGIVFHMGYNVFCDLVKHGRITAVSEEAEKALEAMKDE